jgi:hypothetical protein
MHIGATHKLTHRGVKHEPKMPTMRLKHGKNIADHKA